MRLRFYKFDEIEETIEGPTDCGWLDGYSVGEQVLEGVMFKYTVNEAGDDLIVEVGPAGAGYFETLNSAYWLPQLKQLGLEADIFASSEDGGDDAVSLYDFDKPKDEQQALWAETPEW